MGVIVIVSEQVLPALQAIWYVMSVSDSLEKVVLLHSSDPKFSIAPAVKIQKICQNALPSISTVCVPTYEEEGQGITPEEVTRSIQGVMAKFSTIEHWVINVSGGLKLMTLGMANILPNDEDESSNLPKNITMVYRELTGSWFSLHRKGTQIHSRLLESPSPRLLQGIPVADLVAAQVADDQFVQPRSSLLDANIPAIQQDLLTITKQLIETNWDWQEVFRHYGNTPSQPGRCFEKYITACFYEMGITNVEWSLRTLFQPKIKSTKQTKVTELPENDIVVNHNDQIYFFDLSLRSLKQGLEDETLVKRIVRASAISHKLAGLTGRWVMVRPCQTFAEIEHDLVRAQRSMKLLDLRDAKELLPKIADELRIKLPSTLQAVADLIRADVTPFQSLLSPREKLEKVVKHFGSETLGNEGQNWWLVNLEGVFVFRVAKCIERVQEKKMQEEQDWLAFLSDCGINEPTIVHTAKCWQFLWHEDTRTPSSLPKHLERFLKKEILAVPKAS